MLKMLMMQKDAAQILCFFTLHTQQLWSETSYARPLPPPN